MTQVRRLSAHWDEVVRGMGHHVWIGDIMALDSLRAIGAVVFEPLWRGELG